MCWCAYKLFLQELKSIIIIYQVWKQVQAIKARSKEGERSKNVWDSD